MALRNHFNADKSQSNSVVCVRAPLNYRIDYGFSYCISCLHSIRTTHRSMPEPATPDRDDVYLTTKKIIQFSTPNVCSGMRTCVCVRHARAL